ncbi:MAG: hypothetical protein OdinLCB4_001360 [Candidatus Odinarchaeum yellowstonii]|uniref:Uncharacterized protein n=1 Tax=Odinarchaeota yellowstonii (strain LCB_4) TaxID=1841599 RepID=A0AAF0D2V6_ODILC|nr:MAG: hypothetical protein OdinLCB4_001360 [Candidatus Odinarchaeum yellowstonii]
MSLSKDEVKNLIKSAWSSSSIIIKTDDYLYLLKKEGGKWIELSYMFKENYAEKRELNADEALLYLIEELTKSIVQYSPILKDHIIVEASKLDEILNKI